MFPRPRPSRLALALASLFSLAWVTGCRSLSSANMVPHEVEVRNLHSGSVHVRAHGSARSLTRAQTIEDEALQNAIVEALRETRIFSEVREARQADFHLTVSVTKLEKPEPELDMEARLTCEWTLLQPTGGRAAWHEEITTHFVATTFDADFLEERGELALEGVVRANVREGLERISALELPPPKPAPVAGD